MSNLLILYKEMAEFAIRGKKGESSYDSTQVPFFIQTPEEKSSGVQGFKLMETNQVLERITETMKDTEDFPPRLKRLYKVISDPSVEFYFDQWTLFPLKKVEERRNFLVDNGQTRTIDFAYLGMGMGHVVVACFDTKDQKVFYRRDGGSNGYEREANVKYAKDFNPDSDCNDLKFSFLEWMKDVKNKCHAFDLKAVNSW